MIQSLILLLLALLQSDPVSRSWNEPVEPFRIAGNIYYVGASDITSYLITTSKGHILLDGGFVETAPQIERNIERLGFKLKDVRILLSSHGHYDHAGGLAELKRVTGAKLHVMEREIPLLARGGLDDPQFGDRFPFPRIVADQILRDGDVVSLGNVKMTAHLTAGHTRGCTTWTTRMREGRRDLDVVFLCSPSVPDGYRLTNNAKYPDAIDDYRAQFRFLRSLRPDIFLAAHGNFFDLEAKRKNVGGDPNPFIDPAGYREFVMTMEQRFEARVQSQSQP